LRRWEGLGVFVVFLIDQRYLMNPRYPQEDIFLDPLCWDKSIAPAAVVRHGRSGVDLVVDLAVTSHSYSEWGKDWRDPMSCFLLRELALMFVFGLVVVFESS
jgi:hypothetical protein